MPSIYAHYKFGTLVLEKLPKKEQDIINKYQKSYEIGQQGPDFLFFYRDKKNEKHKRRGHVLHREDAYIFLQNAIHIVNQYGKDSSQYSYILGFICHFVLDSECHPYIMKNEKERNCTHAEIEGDFDQLIMSKDMDNPCSYNLSKLVPTDMKIAESIAPFYDEELSSEKVQKALRNMKIIKRIFYIPGTVKRNILGFILRITKQYNLMYQQAILPEVNLKCRKETETLFQMMNEAVPLGVRLIGNFSKAVDGGALDDGFHKDFLGRKK